MSRFAFHPCSSLASRASKRQRYSWSGTINDRRPYKLVCAVVITLFHNIIFSRSPEGFTASRQALPMPNLGSLKLIWLCRIVTNILEFLERDVFGKSSGFYIPSRAVSSPMSSACSCLPKVVMEWMDHRRRDCVEETWPHEWQAHRR